MAHFNWMLRYKIEQYNSEISGQVSNVILMMRYKTKQNSSKISGELSTFNVNWFCYKTILTKEH